MCIHCKITFPIS